MNTVARSASLLAFVTALASISSAAAQETPFQGRRDLVCTGSPTNCRVTFGEVAANRRLSIDFVSCFLERTVGVEPNKAAFLGVNDAQADAFRHTLIWEDRTAGALRITIVSQPVDVTVRQGQRPDIAIPFATAVTASGDCSISGTLETVD